MAASRSSGVGPPLDVRPVQGSLAAPSPPSPLCLLAAEAAVVPLLLRVLLSCYAQLRKFFVGGRSFSALAAGRAQAERFTDVKRPAPLACYARGRVQEMGRGETVAPRSRSRRCTASC